MIIIFVLGVLPDSSPLLVGSARSAALAGADTVVLLGARSNTVMVMKMAMARRKNQERMKLKSKKQLIRMCLRQLCPNWRI